MWSVFDGGGESFDIRLCEWNGCVLGNERIGDENEWRIPRNDFRVKLAAVFCVISVV